jgi:hypothetical protein
VLKAAGKLLLADDYLSCAGSLLRDAHHVPLEASQRFGMTQSAVSQAVRRAEAATGVTLLDRIDGSEASSRHGGIDLRKLPARLTTPGPHSAASCHLRRTGA